MDVKSKAVETSLLFAGKTFRIGNSAEAVEKRGGIVAKVSALGQGRIYK